MQLMLEQAEIEDAIRAQIKNLFKIVRDADITIELSATCGADGYMARIELPRSALGSGPAPANVIHPSTVVPVTQTEPAPDAIPKPVPTRSLFKGLKPRN